MLVEPKMEDLLPKAENRYTLAILVAKRTRQLVDGARPLIDSDSPNLVTLACEELAEDRVKGIKGIHNVYIPLRPEIEAARLAARAAAEQASLAEAIRESVETAAGETRPTIASPDANLFVTEINENLAKTAETANTEADQEQSAETAEPAEETKTEESGEEV
ncbi:MAG: DNA-directed RNA polymerase subunit omega [Saccharofermentanales bacterium]|jgi:DNA-directed RNA polymerase subunit omega